MINVNLLDLMKYKNIKNKLNINNANEITQDVLNKKDTKVYLLHEFNLEGTDYMICLIEHHSLLNNEINYMETTWIKQLALK